MPTMFGMASALAYRFRLERELGVARHVVQKHRQRQLGGDVFHVFPQLGLPRRKVVGSRKHDGLGAGSSGMLRQINRFDERRIGDADQHGHPAVRLAGRRG